ncbi:Bug family tripartite tricarboxylate transporter substrate binding protein [Acidovorax cavernicola]|uniref:Bug family tripartite tricarboxylate transporter substrate binding protein n=1 Tax=Acidovorax cavernicola TaxID=1675792 RepID=UPI00142E4616|nr:tripartite tricarboxylate transporter substrate binding protein [Acidovorax cavernicola]
MELFNSDLEFADPALCMRRTSRPLGGAVKLRSAAVLLASALASTGSWAVDAYPLRPITLVVPFAIGSGTDLLARVLAADLSRSLATPVVVDNKPGANGAVGTRLVAAAQADGYTLLFGSATTNATNLHFHVGSLGYDEASFVMVAGVSSGSLALYVPHASPWKTVHDLLESARREGPRNLTCGSGNSVTQVACEVLKSATGVDAVTANYKSNLQSLNDVVGGQLSYAFSDPAAALALTSSQRIRAIAIAGPARNASMPGVPTFKEQGFPNIELRAWNGIFAPSGTPKEVVERLNTAVNQWLDSPEANRLFRQMGGEGNKLTVAEAAAFAHAEATRWGDYIRKANLNPK